MRKRDIRCLRGYTKARETKEMTKDIELRIEAIALADPKGFHKPFTTWTI